MPTKQKKTTTSRSNGPVVYDTTFYSWNQELYLDRPFPNSTSWVIWGKHKHWYNNYPGQIDDLYTKSSTFKVVVDRNAAAIHGEGITIEGPPATINGGAMLPQDYLEVIGFSEELLHRISYDLALYNGISLRVILNRSEQVKQNDKIVGVYHTRFSDIRVGAPETPQRPICAYWYSPDWSKVTESGGTLGVKNEPYKPKWFGKFGDEIKSQDGSATRMIYEYIYSPISDFYPLPDVTSCFDALQLGVDLIDFQKSYIANGMTGSAIMYVPFVSSDPSNTGSELNDEDRAVLNKYKKQILDDMTGKNNAGKIALIFYNPNSVNDEGQPIGVPKIESPVQEKNDTKYLDIQKEVRQTITTGLNIISGELFGIPSAGGFSSQSEMLLTANELHYNLVIRPKQKLIERVISNILTYAGFVDFEITMRQSKPIQRNLTVELVEKGIITADEYREKVLGLDPIKPAPDGAETDGGVSLPAKSRFRRMLQMLSD